MNQVLYRAYQGFIWIIFVGLCFQFFLAGLGVFRAANFGPHRTLGDLLTIAAVILLILAVVLVLTSTLERWKVGLAALILVLLLLQYLLASDFLQESAPVISALHPANGLLLVFISYTLARGRGLPGQHRQGRREEAPGNRRAT
jgi:peptidoglycan/LPS O-acetylase OafA/YrhL